MIFLPLIAAILPLVAADSGLVELAGIELVAVIVAPLLILPLLAVGALFISKKRNQSQRPLVPLIAIEANAGV